MEALVKFFKLTPLYRLVLICLSVLVGESIVLGFGALVPFSGGQLLLSLATILLVCFSANWLFAKLLHIPNDIDSTGITALILFLIFAPPTSLQELLMVCLVGILAISSKYVLALNKKHVFNPAAISIVLAGLVGINNSSWWVATPVLLPTIIIVGFIILNRVRRFLLFFTFVLVSFVMIFLSNGAQFSHMGELFLEVLQSWPLIFFGIIMLVEPLTSPSQKYLQLIYGLLVGIVFGSKLQIGPLYATPEMALIVGNIFNYITNPKYHQSKSGAGM